MRQCLNPDCLAANPKQSRFCHQCGDPLLLVERYWAQRVLGEGGFGRTFLAVDEFKPSKPPCVIKQFLPQAQGTASVTKAAELFAQEAQRLEELGQHPQIPALLAYFTADNRQYLVQELIDGLTLAAELEQNGVFNELAIRELLQDLLAVLEFVHQKQVIHRDIKPENIIRRARDRKLVLVDFGAAKQVQPAQRRVTGTAIGSAEYCAPEQAMGKPQFASDLYSLGVTCLHLLTQVSPFDLFDVMEAEWAWRDRLQGNPVSDELGYILDRLIAKPKQRYQSAAAVQADLQRPTPQTQRVTPLPTRAQPDLSLADVPLVSDNGIDYRPLRELLRQQAWRRADSETRELILQLAGRTQAGWLDEDSIQSLACADLRTLSRLWVAASDGKFGFSVQKKIWLALGGGQGSDTIKRLGDALGWRQHGAWLDYSKHTFDLSAAPPGHLPRVWKIKAWREQFLLRVQSCEL